MRNDRFAPRFRNGSILHAPLVLGIIKMFWLLINPLGCCIHFQITFAQLIKLIKVRFDWLNPLTVLNSPSLVMWSKVPWSHDRASPYDQDMLDTRSSTSIKIQRQRSRVQEIQISTRQDYYSSTTKIKIQHLLIMSQVVCHKS